MHIAEIQRERIGAALEAGGELEDVLQRLADAARELLGCEFAGLGLVDSDGAVVLRAASARTPVTLTLGHRQAPGEGVTGEAIRTGKTVLVPDVRTRSNVVPTGPELVSELCVPLALSGAPFGFVDFGASARPLDETDAAQAEALAHLIAGPVRVAVSARDRESKRDELTAMLVHDLRNPATVLSLSLDVLAREGGARSASEERALRDASGSCDELLRLIDGILSIEKAAAGRLTLRLAEVDLAGLVASVAARMHVLASARRVELHCEAARPVPVLVGDGDLLSRVLENLLVNAIKYTPAGRAVHVVVGQAPQPLLVQRGLVARAAALVSVRDEGPGVPEADRERIFEKFAVVGGRSAGRYSTGLGLAFARRAVVAHGGMLWVEAPGSGGSEFRFLLPSGNAGGSLETQRA